MKMDETNIAIIKHLRHGRKSFKKIAEQLSISENTARARVNRLLDEGVLEISARVDPEAIQGHRVVMVGVKLKTMHLVKKRGRIQQIEGGVVSVSVVTGRYDLILVVLLNAGFGLLEFYTEEVSRIEDVQSVETFVVYKGYNLKVPYIL